MLTCLKSKECKLERHGNKQRGKLTATVSIKPSLINSVTTDGVNSTSIFPVIFLSWKAIYPNIPT